jgi:biotin carboxyl carrier protein
VIDPMAVLGEVRARASDRKLRLFACAAAQALRSGGAGGAVAPDVAELQAVADTGILDLYQEGLSEIPSPLFGTVHLRPAPDAAPFVMIGSPIWHHTPLCLIEAMALHQQVYAQESGFIFDVVPDNATVIEYGEPLFRVIPAPTERLRSDRGIGGLVREVFGNPFHPVTVDPAWLTSDVLALASQIYGSCDFSAMPILADALQDAGCDNDDILNHCRDPKQTHIRGCWVVDLVLGKE